MILVSILISAQSLLGLTAGQVGAPEPDFWCHALVSAAVTGDPTTWGGPGEVKRDLVTFEPVPGGIVLTDLGPENDTPEHVAVIETVHADGSLTVIQGNGAPDPEHVTRTVVTPDEIHSTGITEDAHQEYLDGLCTDLQDAKPWIDWDCG